MQTSPSTSLVAQRCVTLAGDSPYSTSSFLTLALARKNRGATSMISKDQKPSVHIDACIH